MSTAEIIPDYTVPTDGALRRAWTHFRVWQLGGATDAWRRALYQGNATLAGHLAAIKTSAKDLESRDMFFALEARDSRFLKWTLDCGASPDLQHDNNCRDYLLHRAAVRGWMHRTELLLEAGANLNVCDNAHSPLGSCLAGFGEAVASWDKRKRVALRLIAAKPDFTLYHWNNRENDFGPCPFDLDVLEALLKAGCDPLTIYNPNTGNHHQPVNGEPVLLFHCGAAHTAKELDAFLTLVERYGMGPKTLSRDGSTLPWMLMHASEAMSEDPSGVLHVLQSHGYDLLGTNAQGDTLLHRAVTHNDVSDLSEALKNLLEVSGMKEQATLINMEGHTPLDVLMAHDKKHNFDKTNSSLPYKQSLALLRSLMLDTSLADTAQVNAPLKTKPRL